MIILLKWSKCYCLQMDQTHLNLIPPSVLQQSPGECHIHRYKYQYASAQNTNPQISVD